MILLAIDSGATGIVGWNFPTDEDIVAITSRFAEMVVKERADGVSPPRLISPRGGLAQGSPGQSFAGLGKYMFDGEWEYIVNDEVEDRLDVLSVSARRIGKKVLVLVVCFAEDGLTQDLEFVITEGRAKTRRMHMFRGQVLWRDWREPETWEINVKDAALIKRGGMKRGESAVIEVESKAFSPD